MLQHSWDKQDNFISRHRIVNNIQEIIQGCFRVSAHELHTGAKFALAKVYKNTRILRMRKRCRMYGTFVHWHSPRHQIDST